MDVSFPRFNFLVLFCHLLINNNFNRYYQLELGHFSELHNCHIYIFLTKDLTSLTWEKIQIHMEQ